MLQYGVSIGIFHSCHGKIFLLVKMSLFKKITGKKNYINRMKMPRIPIFKSQRVNIF